MITVDGTQSEFAINPEQKHLRSSSNALQIGDELIPHFMHFDGEFASIAG